MKSEFPVPYGMESCHITEIGDYYVEGHVPLEGLAKLLTEAPDIDGLVMPGMPGGVPGMDTVQTEDWVIYAMKDGRPFEYMRIAK